MIIDFYTATQLGDKIIFDSKLTLSKREKITEENSTSGESEFSFFDRDFRYAIDGVHFNTWTPLIRQNLDILSDQMENDLQIIRVQFKYTYSGTSNLSPLKINNLLFNNQLMSKDYRYEVTKRTIFGEYINSEDTIDLMNNIGEKLFDLGIVPTFITRKEENFSMTLDEDYIDFWTSVAHYYSLFFTHCLQFTRIYDTQKLLCEFLRQKNIFFCGCSDLEELKLLAKNYFNEMRARGTVEIFKKKGYEYEIGRRKIFLTRFDYSISEEGVKIDGVIYFGKDLIDSLPDNWTFDNDLKILKSPGLNYHEVLFKDKLTEEYTLTPLSTSIEARTTETGIYKKYNGEFLRLICFKNKCDEFFYIQYPIKFSSWNLNNSSPLYRGLRAIENESIVKGYEITKDVLKLSKYPLINASGVSIVSDSISFIKESYPNASVMRINKDSGFGYNILGEDNYGQTNIYSIDRKFFMNISPNIDYEISFWFKQSVVGNSFKLSALTTNCDYIECLPLVSVKDNTRTEYFVNNLDKTTPEVDRWVFARFIIYNSNQKIIQNRQTKNSLSVGTNLIMSELTAKLSVRLICTSGNLKIWNFKIKPSMVESSQCFLDSRNLLLIYLKNNNKNLTKIQLEELAKRYLLPYNFPESKMYLL